MFHRHVRGLILTEQGELLLTAANDIFAKLATTTSLLNEGKETPKGKLTITTTVAFGSTWLAARIGKFLEHYPEIEVSLLINDFELDLSMRQADVAIRLTPPRQSDLIQRHLRTIRFHLYASPRYLENNGMPHSTTDLNDHRIVIYGETPHPPFPKVNWLHDDIMKKGGKTQNQKIVRVNNYYAMFRAVQGGVGIAVLPDYLAAQDANLMRVLPQLEGPEVPAYFVYPEELRNSKRIAVLRDFLIQEIAKTSF